MIEKCIEIRDFFKNENEETWHLIFDKLIVTHRNRSDDDLARAVLRLYGGMGSFNDLVLGRGDFEQMSQVNEKLADLREDLFDAAHDCL